MYRINDKNIWKYWKKQPNFNRLHPFTKINMLFGLTRKKYLYT